MSNPTTHVSQFNGTADGWTITGPERYDNGLWLEEGTVNLFPNPSAETDPHNNWGAFSGTTKTRIDTEHFDGDWSQEYVCDGSGSSQGCAVSTNTGIGTTAERTFTASIYDKGAGTCEIWARASYTDVTTQDSTRKDEVIASDWDRAIANTLTTNPAKTLNMMQVFLRTKTAQAVTFFADAAQIEEKPYATSFVIGTRAASSAALSPAGILSPVSGAIATRLTPTIETGLEEIWGECGTKGTGTDHMQWGRDATKHPFVEWSANNAAYQRITATETVDAETEYFFYFGYNGTDTYLQVDSGTPQTGTRDVVEDDFSVGDLTLEASAGGVVYGELATFSEPLTSAQIATLEARQAWSMGTLSESPYSRIRSQFELRPY